MSDVVVFWCRVSVERGLGSRMDEPDGQTGQRVRRTDGSRACGSGVGGHARAPPVCGSVPLVPSISRCLGFWSSGTGLASLRAGCAGLVVASGGSDGAPVLKTLLAAVRFVVVSDSRCTSLFVCFYDIPTARVRLVRSRNSICPMSSLRVECLYSCASRPLQPESRAPTLPLLTSRALGTIDYCELSPQSASCTGHPRIVSAPRKRGSVLRRAPCDRRRTRSSRCS